MTVPVSIQVVPIELIGGDVGVTVVVPEAMVEVATTGIRSPAVLVGVAHASAVF